MTQAELIIEELLQRIALVEKDRAILLANLKLKEQELEDLRNAKGANMKSRKEITNGQDS